MIKIAMVLAFYLIAGYWQAAPLMKSRRREALVVAGITLLGAWYGVGVIAGWPLPNPTSAIEGIFRPMAELLGVL